MRTRQTETAATVRRGDDEALIKVSGARSICDADPLQGLFRYGATIGTHIVGRGRVRRCLTGGSPET